VETDQRLIEFAKSLLSNQYQAEWPPHPPTPLAAWCVKRKERGRLPDGLFNFFTPSHEGFQITLAPTVWVA
jgi:hypothetical protein